MNRAAIVFGGRGTLGSAIVVRLRESGWHVDVAGRAAAPGVDVDLSDPGWTDRLTGSYDGVVWAQGVNAAGGAPDATLGQVQQTFEANVLFVIETLGRLAGVGRLSTPSRGVVLSSVWQELARPNKLSYIVSKAAIGGLVPSVAIDMADRQFALNALLPGVVDSEMSRTQLSSEQFEAIEAQSIGGQLATPEEVANVTAFLLSPESQGINGQSIVVDRGWSVARYV